MRPASLLSAAGATAFTTVGETAGETDGPECIEVIGVTEHFRRRGFGLTVVRVTMHGDRMRDAVDSLRVDAALGEQATGLMSAPCCVAGYLAAVLAGATAIVEQDGYPDRSLVDPTPIAEPVGQRLDALDVVPAVDGATFVVEVRAGSVLDCCQVHAGVVRTGHGAGGPSS